MSVGHYENFPVASVLLPAALRRPVTLIYRFARTADDFADEGDLAPQERLALLAGYRAELRRLEAGLSPESPLFRELGGVVAAHRLPQEPHLPSARRHGEVRRQRRPDRRRRPFGRLVGPDAFPDRTRKIDDARRRPARDAPARPRWTGNPRRGPGRAEGAREARAAT